MIKSSMVSIYSVLYVFYQNTSQYKTFLHFDIVICLIRNNQTRLISMIISFDHDVTIANNYQTLFIVLYNFIEFSVLSDLIKLFY